MNVILLGPPGCGKGTQGEKISLAYRIPWISTGNILRKAAESKTTLGREAEKFMEQGELVPDTLVEKLTAERLFQKDCSNGFVLDGYPRDVEQARELDRLGIKIDAVIDLQCSEGKALERLTNRRACACGETYHLIYHPPKRQGICDKCGKKLFHREDDKPETIKHRFQVYHRQTNPLLDYYWKKKVLTVVNGEKSIEEVFDEIRKTLETQST